MSSGRRSSRWMTWAPPAATVRQRSPEGRFGRSAKADAGDVAVEEKGVFSPLRPHVQALGA